MRGQITEFTKTKLGNTCHLWVMIRSMCLCEHLQYVKEMLHVGVNVHFYQPFLVLSGDKPQTSEQYGT